jgi:hypothetical protein
MAAGGHFLSDVVWSALLAFGVVHFLYHYVLRIPAHEPGGEGAVGASASHRAGQRVIGLLAALGGLAVLVALFAAPHGEPLEAEIRISSLPRAPKVFEVTARTANVQVIIVDSPEAGVAVSGELHGFGLPTSRLLAGFDFDASPVPTLRYRIEQRGWFTDLDGLASIRLPAGELERVVVRIERGNIRVIDKTRDAVVRTRRLRLDLRTLSGHIQAPGA